MENYMQSCNHQNVFRLPATMWSVEGTRAYNTQDKGISGTRGGFVRWNRKLLISFDL